MNVEARSHIQQVLFGDALEWATDFGAFVLDEHGRYLAVNDYACKLVGLSREELLGLEIGSFNPHVVEEYTAVLEQGRRGGQTHIVSEDGERVDVAYRVSTTKVGGMPFLVVICWPI
jgi:PAS domain S-box-containing protein